MNLRWSGPGFYDDQFYEPDPFDLIEYPIPEPHPRSIAHLQLSARIDCHALLDYEDYLWAIGPNRNKPILWCHTFGSGSMDPETGTIDRPNLIYARRSISTGELTKNGKPQKANLWLHRAILLRAVGEPEHTGMVGDHINGDTLDCRRVNLRWATKVMNARNVSGSAERERLVYEQQYAQIYA